MQNQSEAKSAIEKSLEQLSDLRRDAGKQYLILSKDLRKRRVKNNYLHLCKNSRIFCKKNKIWRSGVIVIAFLISFVFAYITSDIFVSSTPFSISASLLCSILLSIVLFLLLLSPKDDIQELATKESDEFLALANKESEAAHQKLNKIDAKIAHRKSKLAELIKAKQELIESIEYQSQVLYSQNWKAMRSEEFENFLAEVFTLHKYKVQTTSVTGDQGVDLVVEKSSIKTAIQVKGYVNSVGNSAIQQAFAGMQHYRCHKCATITNSVFTKSAIELAESTKCFLIDEDNFEDFVYGRISLCENETV